jgi:sigma-B regulation protein RsbU (phosphoserine phosphatase)
VLLLYTDGVVEARSPGGEEFGEERLRDVVAAAALTQVGQLADGLYTAVRGYVGVELPHDDITLLAMKAT